MADASSSGPEPAGGSRLGAAPCEAEKLQLGALLCRNYEPQQELLSAAASPLEVGEGRAEINGEQIEAMRQILSEGLPVRSRNGVVLLNLMRDARGAAVLEALGSAEELEDLR